MPNELTSITGDLAFKSRVNEFGFNFGFHVECDDIMIEAAEHRGAVEKVGDRRWVPPAGLTLALGEQVPVRMHGGECWGADVVT